MTVQELIQARMMSLNCDRPIAHRVRAEIQHAYDLCSVLLPIVHEHGLVLWHDNNADARSYDDEITEATEDMTEIMEASDVIGAMHVCDVEWLLVCDPEQPLEAFYYVYMVYGNSSYLDGYDGRGEMVADYGGASDWYEIFAPVCDAFLGIDAD